MDTTENRWRFFCQVVRRQRLAEAGYRHCGGTHVCASRRMGVHLDKAVTWGRNCVCYPPVEGSVHLLTTSSPSPPHLYIAKLKDKNLFMFLDTCWSTLLL